ncbi:MAG TPA: sialate O-acetylesterase [Rhodothermales bacterium]|nr:sialate O-acetylesterase [Rhodothermales bacterium]
MMRFLLFLMLMLALSFPACKSNIESTAGFQLSRLISDGMVMQREAEVPVWGWATPGETVSVTFDGQTFSAEADADSTWMVKLPAMDAGGPHEMTIQHADTTVQVHDILIGDVWVASGQSNMEWVVAEANDAEAEIAAANHPAIRHFKVPQSWSETPEVTLAGGAWEKADPEHVGEFTAVGYYFARALREEVDVPIGLLNTSWGGSRIEPWMSAEMLGMGEGGLDQILEQERAREDAIRERVRERIGTLPTEDQGLVNGDARWAATDLDDSDWFTMPVPALWESAGFEGMDGVAWYRTTFDLSEEEAQQGITLGLGMIDDSDITWVNGVEVGRMDNAWNQARVYEVPASALQAGENVLAVRVEDFQGGGGIAGPRDTVFLQVNGEKRSLPDEWRFMVGRVSIASNGNKNQVPTLLWNKMVHPLLPFPIKGVIWYQGESNANSIEEAAAYKALFPEMITGWRTAWKQDDLPFLWAQLANFMAVDAEPPAESNWATLRESQSATLALPNTGEAILIDIGVTDDIHPRNKQDVGRRLALAARKVAYGEDLVYSGPTYRDHEIQDGRVVLSFNHVGGGLEVHGGNLGGFALAGNDSKFVWADAKIEGDQVIVWSEAVPEPMAVRYAWSNNPDKANLYNTEGLPATPFRTDK